MSSPFWNARRWCCRLRDRKARFVYEPLPQDDPKQRRPDITKARQLLGWEPKIDLETGLRKSLDYFRTAVAQEIATQRVNS